ncbi:MAG: beta-propeller fold lactonase family protein [Bacteroidales bacterium]
MRTLQLLLIFITIILLSCTDTNKNNRSTDTFEGVIIVSHKTDNTIHIIERETGETLNILKTGIEPHEVAVSDDGKLAVVCNYGDRKIAGNTLSVYNLEHATLINTIDLGEHERPHGMQWIDGTKRMLVTAESTNSLLIVDIEKAKIIKAIGTEQPVSHMVAATPNYTRAFVPSISTGNVTVIDLQTNSIIDQVYSGEGAEGVAVSPCGEELWVTNRADNTLSVFNTKTLEKTHTLECGDFPIRIKFTPNGSKLLVSNAQSADVAIFNTKEKKLITKIQQTVPLPEETEEERFFADEFKDSSIPIGLVIPHNKTAYVANTNADLISEICLDKMEITRHFPTGKQPDGINYSPFLPKSPN